MIATAFLQLIIVIALIFICVGVLGISMLKAIREFKCEHNFIKTIHQNGHYHDTVHVYCTKCGKSFLEET